MALTKTQAAALAQLPIHKPEDYDDISTRAVKALIDGGLAARDPLGTVHRTAAGNAALQGAPE